MAPDDEKVGETRRRKSLIEDAKFDRVVSAEFKRQQSVSSEVQLKREEEANQKSCFTFGSDGSPSRLKEVVDILEHSKAKLTHLESRPNLDQPSHQLTFFVEFESSPTQKEAITRSFNKDSVLCHSVIRPCEDSQPSSEWFPRHVTDLDKCSHLITKFDPNLDHSHPGFSDMAYRERRQTIADVAFNYKQGMPIPTVEYTAEEEAVWKCSYTKIKSYFPTHACEKHRKGFSMLEDTGLFSAQKIPQLEKVSAFLKRTSGFSLRPVSGLLTARDFLASLALRVFQCTQYTRHPSSPDHSPEPDVIHELLGHIPMLLDEGFAQFSQRLGLFSLGVSDEDIERLATVYWFTVEFGLCKETNKMNGDVRTQPIKLSEVADSSAEDAHSLRAYGAGLLSAYGELTHSLSDVPERLPFDVSTCAVQEYQDADYQPTYFVVDSFEDMQKKVSDFAANFQRPFIAHYNANTQSIEVLNSKAKVKRTVQKLQEEIKFLEEQHILKNQ